MTLFRYFRWLSLDIVLGAVIFLKFLADHYLLDIPIQVYISLGIAIWLIYTTDHIIDARSSKCPDARRLFHLGHQRSLFFVSGLLAVAGLLNVYYLPVEIIRSGALLSAFCLTYLMIVYFFPGLWFKEMIVAVGYTAGIFLAPFTMKATLQVMDFVLFAQLMTLAAINLLIFSFYDRKKDKMDGFGSMILKLESKSTLIIHVLISIVVASSLYMLLSHPFHQLIQLVYLLMALVFYMIISFRNFFSQVERFRILGDAAFFIPVIFLI